MTFQVRSDKKIFFFLVNMIWLLGQKIKDEFL